MYTTRIGGTRIGSTVVIIIAVHRGIDAFTGSVITIKIVT
jgi:hypothetical protein